jgi:nitroimidazol reductase NimA-like FMN-containing flavoprotein (pyridoxamine 5'-phosphate oxidase superfamily)
MSPELAAYQEYLQHMRIPLRLSCKTASGWPVVLSLWYLYEDGALYCATKGSARVVEHLMNDPRCAFEIAGDTPPYCGVRGQARAVIEPAKGGETLRKLLQRYQGGTETELAQKLLKNPDAEVAIRLEPVNLFQWDFSKRMQPLGPEQVNPGVCP